MASPIRPWTRESNPGKGTALRGAPASSRGQCRAAARRGRQGACCVTNRRPPLPGTGGRRAGAWRAQRLPEQLDAWAGACGCADPASNKPEGRPSLRGEADRNGELPAHLRGLRPPAAPVAFLSICGHFILVNALFFLRQKYWCQFHPQLKNTSEPSPCPGPEGKHHRRETDIDSFAWKQKNKCHFEFALQIGMQMNATVCITY